MLACLIGYFGDFDLAEEAAAEAFAVAAQRWPSGGVPDNPGAWLVTTARHRAIDRLRRDRVLAAKLRLLAAEGIEEQEEDGVTEPAIPDERLELVFMCCHPALAIEAQVALTLRAVGGLTTEEIARAFLVPAETMKRRLTRAKSKIKLAGIPFSVPAGAQLPERLGAVLAVVYLIFNEGYSFNEGDGVRVQRPGKPVRPGRRGDPARPGAGRAAPGRAGGARAAGADAAARRAPRGEVRRPGPGAARGPGPVAVGLAADRRGPGPARPGPAAGDGAPTPCRPRSPPCRPPNGSTGRRSPRSTANSPTGPARPWSG